MMAASFPLGASKQAEVNTQLVEFFDGSRRTPQFIRAAPSKRRSVLQAEAFVALASALAVVALITTCYREAGERKALRREREGRRLAAHEVGNEQDDELVSHLLDWCMASQAELGYSSDEAHLSDETEAISGIWSSTRQLEEELQGDTSYVSSALLPTSQDDIPFSPLFEYEYISLADLLSSKPYKFQQATDASGSFEELRDLPYWSPSAFLSDEGSSQAPPSEQGLSGQDEPVGLQQAQRGLKRSSEETEFGEASGQPDRQKRKTEGSESDGIPHVPVSTVYAGSPAAGTTSEVHEDYQLPEADAPPSRSENDLSDALSTSDESSASSSSHSVDGLSDTSSGSSSSFDFALFPEVDFTLSQLGSLPEPAPSMAPDTHLHYRLPVLEEGVLYRTFDVSFARNEGKGGRNIFLTLCHMRALLAERRLSLLQAEELIADSENIVNYLLTNYTPGDISGGPFNVVKVLGVRYLLLEAVFCSIQVLGPAMKPEMWWSDFVTKVPSGFDGMPGEMWTRLVASLRADCTCETFRKYRQATPFSDLLSRS
ncbi:hypothetical protein Efla_002549 [Eimeria flavescens]